MSRPHPAARPHGELTEVLPDIFFVTGSVNLGPLGFSRAMTVVREGDRLVLFNSVRLNEEGLAQLDALGKVTDVVKLAGAHGMDDPFYKERYGATVHGLKGQTWFTGPDVKKGTVYFEPDNELEPGGPMPLEGADVVIIDGQPPEGFMRLDRHGGTIISGDALQNWETTDPFFSFVGKLGMRALGFIRPAALGAGWLKFVKPPKDQVRGILDLEFANVFPCHGTPVIGGASGKYRPAIEKYAGA